jgi:hypothetical protein
MNPPTALTSQQLRAAASLKERIEALERELGQILGQDAGGTVPAPRKRRKLSARGIANIRAGARRRWAAAAKSANSQDNGKATRKRKMSAAAKAALSAAAKARWAKAKAAGKTKL